MVASNRIPPRRRPAQLKATRGHSHNRIRKRHYTAGSLKGKKVTHTVSRKPFITSLKHFFSLSRIVKNLRHRRIKHLQESIAIPPQAQLTKMDQKITAMVTAITRGSFNDMVNCKNEFGRQFNLLSTESNEGSKKDGDDLRQLFMRWAESTKNLPVKKQLRVLLKTPHSQLHKNAIGIMSIYGGCHDYNHHQADFLSNYNLLIRCLIEIMLPKQKDVDFINSACDKEALDASPHSESLLKKILAIQPVPPAERINRPLMNMQGE